jgi:hypothetical protein
MREVSAHYPTGLTIVVDGQVVAVRDISSPRAILRVETHSISALEMVEVFSEQNLLMLMLPVPQHPPQSPPELRNEIALSDERSLSLTLRFTGEGALIEAAYADPNFGTELAEADIRSIADFYGADSPVKDSEHLRTVDAGDVQRGARWRLRKLWSRLTGQAMRRATLVPIAVALLLAAAGTWTLIRSQREQTHITSILHDSTRAERRQRIAHGPGVIYQRVVIRGGARNIERDLHRDIDGRRHPKAPALDNGERALREKLAEADTDWNDPLSASGFDNWHDHVPHQPDRIETTAANFLTITTTPTSGPVLGEALTLRLTDLHAVSRSFVFRDHETIEVAEISYEVRPWEPASEEWFEPLDTVPVAPRQPRSSLPAAPAQPRVSETEIDLAKLEVLLAIQELSADTERLQINRGATGVVVTGVVATEARKLEIAGRLRTIPHVAAEIHSYRDFDAKPDPSSVSNTIKAVTVVTGTSPLDDYCETRQVSRDRCQQLGYRLLNSSTRLGHVNSQIADLDRQYPSTRPLSSSVQMLLAELMHRYVFHITDALSEQRMALAMLGMDYDPEIDARVRSDESLSEAIHRNFNLTKELVYAKDEHSRTATLVIQDLAESAEEVRAAVSNAPFNTTSRAASPQ